MNFVLSSATTNARAFEKTNQAPQVKTNLTNMVANTAKVTIKPAVNLAAKQARSDLVEAIIFME
jgi:hypothetical protein